MLFASLSRPDLLADAQGVCGVELRLDLFPFWDLGLVKQLMGLSKVPLLFTLRKSSHGGKYSGSEEEREKAILALLQLKPDFFDLEYDMRKAFLVNTIENHPATKFILSYHNFEKTPEDLDSIFNAMAKTPAFGYKIATLALSTNDALRLLLLSKKHPNLSGICMGERGEFARVLGPFVSNLIDYGCINSQEKTALGQLSIEELVHIYRYRNVNQNTRIYGLIGDPVVQSRGHIHHNDVFSKNGLNAVYVKMKVSPFELNEFFPLAKQLGFCGLSVTMPLKEKVLPYIDEKDLFVTGCESSNTLLLQGGKIQGTNTDGRGALDAIEKKMKVQNKVVVLIGAGGSARSIAFEAKARGAHVWILNRTVSKARLLGSLFGCRAGSLTDFPSHYDILINCSSDPMPMDEKFIDPKALVMDIVYVPKETAFIKAALVKGCDVIYGEEMFYHQAALQTKFWI